ncbi:GAF domain-containing sensor histidine kinase [Ectobacillus funiculus]|uniref:sensor histidine kinase n=1 Tax=Ectobacillus funiculus TaxID=137993 RepID=UPI00397CB81B
MQLSDCADPGQLLLKDEMALKQLGISPAIYSLLRVLVEFFQGACILTIAIIIFIKKYRDWFSLFVSVSIAASGNVITINTIRMVYPSMDFIWNIIIFLASGYVIFFYVFPNGKFVPRWTRLAAGLWMFTTIGRVFFNGSPIDPFTWEPILNFGGWIAFHIIALIAQIQRYKFHSNAIEKQQTKWFLFGLAGMVAGIMIESIIDHSQHLFTPGLSRICINLLSEFIISLLFIGIPLSIGIAIQKYRLWDIDYLINRTLIYAILTAGVIITYILIVSGVSALFQSSENYYGSLIASAIVAVIFQPLRTFIQGIINRFMYGERDNPYTVIAELGQRLESSPVQHEILQVSIETVARSLKLPYAAITIFKDGSEVISASVGNRKKLTLNIPLIYQSERVGSMLLSARSLHDDFSSKERRLLNDLAPQIAIAVNNVRLTTKLQNARKQLVSTREEERKRIRRDLHDGLGPELAGLLMQMDAAKNLLYQNPDKVFELLTQMNGRLKFTIQGIRELVYGLRPPVLDEFGLIYAVREQVEKLKQTNNLIQLMLDVPESLPELSAAVEAACFRIIQEALTNVIKHSTAETCSIKIWIENDLCIKVTDDGIGIDHQRKGVGLLSMKERAEELGGQCTFETLDRKGTVVYARLPINKER